MSWLQILSLNRVFLEYISRSNIWCSRDISGGRVALFLPTLKSRTLLRVSSIVPSWGSCLLSHHGWLVDGRQRSFSCLALGPKEQTVLLPLTKEPGEPPSGSGNQLVLELRKSLKERLYWTGELTFSKSGDTFLCLILVNIRGQRLGSVGTWVTLLRVITQNVLLNQRAE